MTDINRRMIAWKQATDHPERTSEFLKSSNPFQKNFWPLLVYDHRDKPLVSPSRYEEIYARELERFDGDEEKAKKRALGQLRAEIREEMRLLRGQREVREPDISEWGYDILGLHADDYYLDADDDTKKIIDELGVWPNTSSYNLNNMHPNTGRDQDMPLNHIGAEKPRAEEQSAGGIDQSEWRNGSSLKERALSKVPNELR